MPTGFVQATVLSRYLFHMELFKAKTKKVMRPIIFNETWLCLQVSLIDETETQVGNMTFLLTWMKESTISIEEDSNGDMFYITNFTQVGI